MNVRLTLEDEAEEDALISDFADTVSAFVVGYHEATGISLELLLVGAHAGIVALITTSLGGKQAAAICANAAETVRALPALADDALAAARPVGHA